VRGLYVAPEKRLGSFAAHDALRLGGLSTEFSRATLIVNQCVCSQPRAGTSGARRARISPRPLAVNYEPDSGAPRNPALPSRGPTTFAHRLLSFSRIAFHTVWRVVTLFPSSPIIGIGYLRHPVHR